MASTREKERERERETGDLEKAVHKHAEYHSHKSDEEETMCTEKAAGEGG
jgi:hypothetical protein